MSGNSVVYLQILEFFFFTYSAKLSAFLISFDCKGPRLTIEHSHLLKIITAVFQTQLNMKKQISVDDFINSANDPKLIESKARFVIDFLKIGLE